MNYTEFADKMLIALYQESENDEPYPEGITFGALIERYGLPDNSRWLDRLAEEWQSEGIATVSDLLEPTRDLPVEIAGRGMRRVEQIYGGKDGVGTILQPAYPVPVNALVTENGDPIVTEDGDYIVVEDGSHRVTEEGSRRVTADGNFRVVDEEAADFHPNDFDPASFETGDAVHSQQWTGLPRKGTLQPDASQRVLEAIKLAEQALERSGATNEQRAQAVAYIVAIRALAEAPEPPADLIWQMVNRINSIAGIAGLFVALIGLFT